MMLISGVWRDWHSYMRMGLLSSCINRAMAILAWECRCLTAGLSYIASETHMLT